MGFGMKVLYLYACMILRGYVNCFYILILHFYLKVYPSMEVSAGHMYRVSLAISVVVTGLH